MLTPNQNILSRPVLANSADPIEFLRAMVAYLKATERNFSVLAASRNLRKVSPALVSLILQKKRNLTLDRLDELGKLLRLTAAEKTQLRVWILKRDEPESDALASHLTSSEQGRKEVSTHILKDWVNVYVKDCFQIPAVQRDRSLVFRQLANLASPRRIEKSINFLLREGHLRKTLDGRIVTETPLTTTDPQISSEKIRQFHKGALQVAQAALESHPAHERYANTFIVPVDEAHYQQLIQMIQDFAEKMKDFAVATSGTRLYQVIINASPTGGKFE